MHVHHLRAQQEHEKECQGEWTALLQDLIRAFEQRDGADLAKAERLLATIEKTYSVSATEVPRLALRDPCLLLTRLYNSMNRQDKVKPSRQGVRSCNLWAS